MIRHLLLENFRCFAGDHQVRLGRINLLVGENSSGKSSFLAAARLAWDCGTYIGRTQGPDFNDEPFPLGAFRQIATANGNGSAQTFGLGLTLDGSTGIRSTFREEAGQPKIAKSELVLPPVVHQISFEIGESVSPPPSIWGSPSTDSRDLFGPNLRPIAFAPIRIRPKRTYDPVQDLPDPSGIHVPMVLARIRASDEASWERIAETLRRFGKASGLLQDLEVRRLGHQDDPFQVEVKIHGKSFNLMDVGYGVSQILPILVECTRAPQESVFLLQQPEVHLHPRAQAELGSFFATLVKERDHQYLIETHSDHLVDRLRLEVRDGRLAPSDLAILFFERDAVSARIHQMSTDEQGNLLAAPPGYRQFFFDEERRLLGF